MHTNFLRLAVLAASASMALVACGGGGGGDAKVTGTDVNVSATQNSNDAVTFVRAQINDRTSDGNEPIVVGDVTLATSDDSEPVAGLF